MPARATPPAPPKKIHERTVATVTINRRRLLYRIHRTEHEPLFYGRTGANRFDAPDKDYGVCYLGLSINAAFAETFLRRPGAVLIDWPDLAARSVTVFRVTETLRPARLYGPGLSKMGATAGVTHGPHAVAQSWSAALQSHPDAPDGIVYRARHDDDHRCLALFQRESAPFEPVSTTPLVDDVKTLGALLDHYEIGVANAP